MEAKHLDGLPNLQRLFLSNNCIEAFEDVDTLFVLQNLMELTMDSNPVAGRPHYRQSLLDQVRSLRLLDLQRISDEERRLSHLVVKKEEEKAEADKRKQAADRVREQAIEEVHKEWLRKREGLCASGASGNALPQASPGQGMRV